MKTITHNKTRYKVVGISNGGVTVQLHAKQIHGHVSRMFIDKQLLTKRQQEALNEIINPAKYSFTFNGRKNEYGEYVVKCYRNGKRHSEGDYFTDDKQDAIDTKRHLENQQLEAAELVIKINKKESN